MKCKWDTQTPVTLHNHVNVNLPQNTTIKWRSRKKTKKKCTEISAQAGEVEKGSPRIKKNISRGYIWGICNEKTTVNRQRIHYIQNTTNGELENAQSKAEKSVKEVMVQSKDSACKQTANNEHHRTIAVGNVCEVPSSIRYLLLL